MTSKSRSGLTSFDLMDAARALASILVVAGHERNILFQDATPHLTAAWKLFYFITGFGHQSVMIFFVLSGYWITKSVVRRMQGQTWSWPDYGMDRLSRLWVVLIPALVLGGLFDLVGRYYLQAPLYLGIQGTHNLTWDVAMRLGVLTLAGNLVFLQTLLVEPFGSNGPLWSLAFEFWYYLCFPILYQLVRFRHVSFIALPIVIVVLAAFPAVALGFVCWLFGAAVLFATKGQRKSESVIYRFLAPTAALLFLAVLSYTRLPNAFQFAGVAGSDLLSSSLQDFAVSGSFAIFLLFLLKLDGRYPYWLRPLCKFGAGSSFSLYAMHFPFVALACAVLATPAMRLPPSATALTFFGGIFALTIVSALVFSRLTEARTASVRDWMKARWAGFVGGAD